MRRIFFASIGMTVCAVGCGRDFKAIADQHVEQRLFDKHEKREAIRFFEQEKGRFIDVNQTTSVDRDVVLPLLKRLHETVPTEQWAILKSGKTDQALAVLIQLPKDPMAVDRMAELVQQADDNFSGFILQQWGHAWLKINLIDQEAYEFLKKADPDVDKQR